MKQFVYHDTNSAQKFISMLNQFHLLLSPNFIFILSLSSSLSAHVQCELYTGSLPENRAFTLHYPTPAPTAQTFSHPVFHPLSMTQDTVVRPCSDGLTSLRHLSPFWSAQSFTYLPLTAKACHWHWLFHHQKPWNICFQNLFFTHHNSSDRIIIIVYRFKSWGLRGIYF